jgi:uncharacterized protein YmfQ (DUF2313 family)
MTKLFKDKTSEDQANSLAQFLPEGKAFDSKYETAAVLRKLLEGVSDELKRVYDGMNDLSEDYDINSCTELITNWESAVGIPDDCFPGTGDIAERRTHVLIKLAKMNVQTADEFIEVIELLGFTVTLTPGADIGLFPLGFPIEFFKDPQQARFTLVVDLDANNAVFPLPFPVQFASSVNNIVICVLNVIKPANVELQLRFTG